MIHQISALKQGEGKMISIFPPSWKQACLPFETFADFRSALAKRDVHLGCDHTVQKKWVADKDLAPMPVWIIALGFRLLYRIGIPVSLLILLYLNGATMAFLVGVGFSGSMLLRMDWRAEIRWPAWIVVSGVFGLAILLDWTLAAITVGISLLLGVISAGFWFWSKHVYCKEVSSDEYDFLLGYWNGDIWFFLDGELWRRWNADRLERFLYGNRILPTPRGPIDPASILRFGEGLDRLSLRHMCAYEVTHQVAFGPICPASEKHIWYVQLLGDGKAFTARDISNCSPAEWKVIDGQWIHQGNFPPEIVSEEKPDCPPGTISVKDVASFSLEERKDAYKDYVFWISDLIYRINAGGTMKVMAAIGEIEKSENLGTKRKMAIFHIINTFLKRLFSRWSDDGAARRNDY